MIVVVQIIPVIMNDPVLKVDFLVREILPLQDDRLVRSYPGGEAGNRNRMALPTNVAT